MSDSSVDHVIIIGAGPLVAPAYRLAREVLGLATIGVDRDGTALAQVGADIAAFVSTKDVEAVVAEMQRLAAAYRIVGVFTCGADVEVTVAAVAEALGLPCIPLEVARRCNDKVAMHRFLDQRGFTAKARWALVHSLEEAQRAVARIGFPCVLKPIDNCASRGVQIIADPTLLAEAFTLAAESNIGAAGVLLEEALAGSKHTVEMIVENGQWHLLSIIDTHYISPRWPCETGLETTSLPEAEQQRAFEFAAAVARDFGIDFGCHKIDINRAADGTLTLIELTARLSGGFHCQIVSPLAFGSNDILAGLKMACGLGLDASAIAHKWQRGAAVRCAFPAPGRLMHIDTTAAQAVPGVREVFVMRRLGDIVGPYLNSADRPAFVIAEGATTAEAIATAEAAVALLVLETEALQDQEA
ncbi:MAG: ATP-grasp domain-containing protein [Rhodospirillaceae bacterium]